MQIEARHLQPAVGIPGPARADIKQPGPGFGEHFPSVDEVQIDLLTGAQRLRKNDSDQIVASPRQLRALERLVVNKFHWNAVGFHFADLEEAGQFEEHSSLARLPHFKLQAGLGIEPGGRRHFCLDLVLRNADCFGLGLFSHHSGGIAGAAARFAHG